MQPALSTRIQDGFMAAMRLGGEKPHQGLPSENPAPNQVREVCKFTVLLGMRGQTELNRAGSCCTGKERDTESGNDYFGARYYSSAMGRFMSPDWSAQAEPVPYANLDNPQSLNLYAYVGNNPLGRVDANGHCWGWIQWACNAAQSLKNGFTPNGGGFHTDATVKKEAARQRQWLLDQGLNTDQGHIVQNASDKDIRGMYGCFHNPRCMSAIANILATTVTQFGYPGQKGYNDAKNQLNKANTPEGTINNQTLGPNGKIPTQSEAIQMIEESGGKVERIEAGHGPDSVSTHDYPHINYTTESGVKGTIQIQP